MISGQEHTLASYIGALSSALDSSLDKRSIPYAKLQLATALAEQIDASQFYVDKPFTDFMETISDRMTRHYRPIAGGGARDAKEKILDDAKSQGRFYQEMISGLTSKGYLTYIKRIEKSGTLLAQITFENKQQEELFFTWMDRDAKFPATAGFNANKSLFQFDEEKMEERDTVALTAHQIQQGGLAINFPTAEAAALFFKFLNMKPPASIVDLPTFSVISIPMLKKENDRLVLQVSKYLASAEDYLTLLKIKEEIIRQVLIEGDLISVKVLVDLILEYCTGETERCELTAKAASQKYPPSGINARLQHKFNLFGASEKTISTTNALSSSSAAVAINTITSSITKN